MTNITFRPASAADWRAVAALLTAAGLPLAGAEAHLDHFLLAFKGDALVGCAGLEPYGATALVRSLAVAEAERGSGLGQSLVRALVRNAAAEGFGRLVLLTTTAERFFPRFGFRPITAAEAPAEVKASAEFRGVCPASAMVMQLDLAGGH